jgi:1-acyl-sn-glycerol-3-phosphate acyltransferase
MKLVERIALLLYNAWSLLWFVGIYLILFPFIYIAIQRKYWHPIGHKLTQIWSYLLFFMIGKKIRVKKEFEMNPTGTYVFVANHFSYLDIAAGMGIFQNHFAFIGKSSVRKMPLLGYMFYKLHIMVDRSDKNSRSNSLNRGIKSLKSGRSVFIMPEGGIISRNIPQMEHPFKDGAFIMAIENQVPIVPITFVNNYKIMPEFKLRWGTPEVVIHKAISTKNKTKADINVLREEVYGIIQKTLDEHS